MAVKFDQDVSRNYVIVHYQSTQTGRQENIFLPKEGSEYRRELADLDVNKPVTFTIADPQVGQFETDAYYFNNGCAVPTASGSQ